MNPTLQKNKAYPFLQGGGELGELILHHDWSRSPVGPIERWPLSLRTTIGNMLHSAFPMFLFWGDDLICFYNDAYRPSLGNNGKHPAIGKKAFDVWPEIWPVIHPMIEQAMKKGVPNWSEDELIPIYRNGKLEQVNWTYSYSPAYGDDGTICGVLVTCMETTERVLARRKIEDVVASRTAELEEAHDSVIRANSYLQKVINLFKEPLQVLEPVIENGAIVDFRYKLTNAAYAAYADTTPDQLENKKVGDVFPGYFQTASFTKAVETFETGAPDTFDIHYNADGLDLYNQMSTVRMDGEVIIHFTDFTKLKHLQLELLHKIEELERSNQNLEEFAHAASHDLKEPIRKIHVFTTLLKDQLSDRLTESEIKTFEKIGNATKRMSHLVDDLLLYSHVSQRPHQKEAVDLNEILKQALEDLELDVQQKAAIINNTVLPSLRGYRRQLQQMFQNLLSNALKYTKPGTAPRIDITSGISTEGGHSYHVIEVRDHGIGFDQQYADKIFQMFIRLHNKEAYNGTGVGLSIVKKVIENHDGLVKAESRPGEGALFKVYLPAD